MLFVGFSDLDPSCSDSEFYSNYLLSEAFYELLILAEFSNPSSKFSSESFFSFFSEFAFGSAFGSVSGSKNSPSYTPYLMLLGSVSSRSFYDYSTANYSFPFY